MSKRSPVGDHLCRCRHKAIDHESPLTDPRAVGCLKCDRCSGFSPRPAPWLVRREPIDAATMPVTGPWQVISPRGVVLVSAARQRPAAELAHSFAAIEEMLARVRRLERAVLADHPALKASARPPGAAADLAHSFRGTPPAASVTYIGGTLGAAGKPSREEGEQ